MQSIKGINKSRSGRPSLGKKPAWNYCLLLVNGGPGFVSTALALWSILVAAVRRNFNHAPSPSLSHNYQQRPLER